MFIIAKIIDLIYGVWPTYGILVILYPDNRCNGVKGLGLFGPWDMYVCQMPLVQQGFLYYGLQYPSTLQLLIADLVRPTRPKAPEPQSLFGMKLQFTPSWLNTALTSSDEDSDFSPSAADWKIMILSEISWDVIDNLHPAKQRNASINVSTNRSVTTFRCMTLLVVQVNKHMYTSVSSLLWYIYRAPVKLTPITQKGCMSCVLNLGSEAG